MEDITLRTIFLNNTIGNYLLAFIFLILVYYFIKLFDRFILDKMDIFIDKFSHSFSILLRNIIKKRVYPLLYLLAVYFAFIQLQAVSQVDQFVNSLLMILAVIFSVFIINDLISYSLKKYWEKKERSEDQQKVLSITLFFIKCLIWIIAFLFILDNLDIQITGLMTGLGIGGIAIAFAAQNILADLFNYFTIFFDKPFDVGDFIITGENRGTIEHIGLKTTRIRSITGEQLIISNTDLVNSRINNYKRMTRRRINFSFGLTYDTPLEKLKQVPKIIEEIFNSVDKAELDRAHFAEFAASSLLFQIVFYVNASDFKTYMDVQQQINFKLRERMDQLGVSFAFPTQTIHLAEKNLENNLDLNNANLNNENYELNREDIEKTN